MGKRGYYRVSKKCPANRIDGIFIGIIQTKFAEGWPKARIAREFRLNRRTVARICSVGSKSGLGRLGQLGVKLRTSWGNLLRPESWLPYVFTSPEEAADAGLCN